MDIRPILSTLSRHKTAAGLIVLEVALTCAIICNAVFLIGQRLEHMQRDTGVAESELLRIQITGIGAEADSQARTQEDLAALRAVPGVRYAAATNQVPLGRGSWNFGVSLEPDQQHDNLVSTIYMGTPDLLETLGVQLSSGRDFTADEYLDFRTMQLGAPDAPGLPSAIITRAIADKLFPGENPVGKSIYGFGEKPAKVVGVTETLLRPNEGEGSNAFGYATILPLNVTYDMPGGQYLIRVNDSAQRVQVLNDAVAALQKVNSKRIVLKQESFAEIRADYYKNDRAMAWLLVTVCVALLLVTAFGVVGLASFWVAQRTRQIGIRRALGGTKGQILSYFLTENFLLTTLGVALGMMLAYGLNQWLMTRYELPRLPIWYLPIGAILLWTLGQLAVLGPARRAAAVPPAIATRSA